MDAPSLKEKELSRMKIEMEPKVIIVMPAYNSAAILAKTAKDIPECITAEIILVYDLSKDDTAKIAKDLRLTVIVHDENRGYGANQKTCYDEALKRDADLVVTIRPNCQYDSSLAPLFVELIKKGICDIALGSHIRTRRECLDSAMPLYTYLSNRFLTFLENLVAGENLSEWHTGFRAYSRKVFKTIPYHKNSNDFVFDSQFLSKQLILVSKSGASPSHAVI
jgi:glycosyltransferase involved in cell wall biosynthesis